MFWPPRFGEVGGAHGVTRPTPVPEGLDWDLYLGPAPWIPYDGNTGPHRFDIGELNWGQHHYDIVQWAAGADDTGPVEIFVEDGRSGYKYANGVVVYGKPFPGEPVGGEGGACFVGTGGRIAVDRGALVSDPPDIVREPLRPDEVHLYHQELVSEGWTVLLLNPRGSDGYGEDFFTAVYGGWGVNDAQDFLEPIAELGGICGLGGRRLDSRKHRRCYRRPHNGSTTAGTSRCSPAPNPRCGFRLPAAGSGQAVAHRSSCRPTHDYPPRPAPT